MLKRKGQNTVEYAILFALVIAAAIAMQTYVKRSFQGGVKFTVDKLRKDDAGNTQYEPYYLEHAYTIASGEYLDSEATNLDGQIDRLGGLRTSNRTGYQTISNTENAD